MGAISLKWDITGRCNLRCGHCLQGERLRDGVARSADTSPPAVELDEAQFEHIIEKLPASEIVHINLLGGEPTLLGEKFLNIIKHCSDKGIKTTFNTNGLLLKQPFIQRVIDAGAAGIILSIDGPTAESHDAVRGKGTFEVITKNLSGLMKHIRQHGIPFETTVSTVVTPYNGDILGRMVDYCVDTGVDTLNLLPISYTGFALEDIRHLYISEKRELEIAEAFVEHVSRLPGGLNDLRVEARFILPPLANYLEAKFGYALRLTKNCCSATTTFGYINPSGELFPCDRIAYEFADVDFRAPEGRRASLLKWDFGEIWNSSFHTNMFQYVTNHNVYRDYSPCDHCEYLEAGLCVPCPLFRLRKGSVSFYQCRFAEQQLGTLELSDRHRPDRTTGSHYLNQYQPKQRVVMAQGRNRIAGKLVQKAKGIRWNVAPGREILFNPHRNKFYSLNPLGRRIWNEIDCRKTEAEILQSVQQQVTDPADAALRVDDVCHFLDALASEGLIEVCG